MLVAGRLRGVKTGKDWQVARVEVERFMNVTREQAGPVAATNQQTGDELTLAEVDAETWATYHDEVDRRLCGWPGRSQQPSSRILRRSAGR